MILKTGLWKYSRHPNHLGEMIFWIGIALYAIATKWYWLSLGFVFNHVCDVLATIPMMDKRMASNPDREADYRIYEKETPSLIPYTIFCGAKSKTAEENHPAMVSEDNNFEL